MLPEKEEGGELRLFPEGGVGIPAIGGSEGVPIPIPVPPWAG